MATDSLADAVHNLPAPWHGHYFAVVDSTQTIARDAAERGAPDRSLFVADFQQSGRGRATRQWLARPGTGLLVSMLFREPSSRPWRFTCLASVALVDAIAQQLPNASVAIKWPNDVMLEDRKVAGILAATSWNGQELLAIVGIGVNVSATRADLSGLPDATSLALPSAARGVLLRDFTAHLDTWRARPEADLHACWESRLWRRGQRLRLVDGTRTEEVIVLGAAADGQLRVRTHDGVERTTSTGELLG